MPRSYLVILALAAGCVIALTIAVVRSLSMDYSGLAPLFLTPTDVEVLLQDWQSSRPASFPEVSEFDLIDGYQTFGMTVVNVGIEDQTSIFRLTRFRAGWPVKCLEGDQWHDVVLGPDTSLPGATMIITTASTEEYLAVILRDQIPMISLSRPKLLPYGVKWGGLAINSVIYGVAILVCWWVMVMLRERRRVRDGCCRACGHQLHISTICPECGTARSANADPLHSAS